MIYKKSGNYKNIDEYILAITGKTIQGLNSFKKSYTIKNLDLVAQRLKKAARDKQLVYVYGDYDTDGITCVSEMGILLSQLKVPYKLYCPRRFSDGYGINSKSILNVPRGSLLITVDNGIAAIEALEIASKMGIETIILDHHMGNVGKNGEIILPKASIIVDPEALPAGCDFDGYCGAGIVCELAKILLPDGSRALEYIKALAAIGTVADVVPLISANRKIVKEGLENLNKNIGPIGLNILKEQIKLSSNINGPLYAEHLGYYLSPCFNAASRLKDTGAIGVVATIFANDIEKASDYSSQLIKWNLERKEITEKALEKVEIIPEDNVNFVLGDISAGCIGLVASKLVEMTGKPSFVVSPDNNGVLRGSARSNSPLNNVKYMLDECSHYLGSYGGHSEAAGFSLPMENFNAVHDILNSLPLVSVDTTPTYDLDIQDALYIPNLVCELDNLEPFGKGVERPLFRLKADLNRHAEPTSDGKHLKFELPGNIKGIGFNITKKHEQAGSPTSLYLYGDLKYNYFNGAVKPQMIIKDFEVA